MKTTEEKMEALLKNAMRCPLTEHDKECLAELRRDHGIKDDERKNP
jgi:hypothetical protein